MTLTKRANKASLPDVHIIDLRQELSNGNRSIISNKLYEEMEKNLNAKEQTILFLNKRGFSTFVMCRDCGYTVKCKRCNISLTYHEYTNTLKCHYCGYEIKNVNICPSCKSKNIKYFGTGTEKLQSEIQKLFPKATTIRMDIDTVSKKNSHENILNKFKNENIDILIGTQMVVKGHHFPNVTLVGVVAADDSLNIEDYRANERTFAILTQVAGRAGREKQGRVIIQTYNPENFCIECAKKQNYDDFYNIEIQLRKQLKYPPFCDIIMFGINSTNKDEVQIAAKKLYNILQKNIKNCNVKIELYNPVIAPISKIKNKYRWRIIGKCILSNNIINIINNSLNEYYDLKLKNTRVIADINPNNMN
ncbi:MAG: primosomal protein N' [Clostridia bacterium]|nr:primosomal protein N' [Clostridia bacterium]